MVLLTRLHLYPGPIYIHINMADDRWWWWSGMTVVSAAAAVMVVVVAISGNVMWWAVIHAVHTSPFRDPRANLLHRAGGGGRWRGIRFARRGTAA